jgi:membrane protease subunit HflK
MSEFDPMKHDLQKLFGQFGQVTKGLPVVLFTLFLIIGGCGAMSSFYTVQPDEEAVVLRFGKYHATSPPGLHFKVPFGIDRAIRIQTKQIKQEEFGFRTASTRGARTSYSERQFDEESLMLTGDLNVADVEWITQYQISEPQKYLFNAKEPIKNIRDISEAIMRRVVGDRLVGDVLTVGRQEIAIEAKNLMQDVLDKYDMGIRVVSIKLQDVNPPDPVKPSFNDVNSAKQEQEQLINQAEREYNKVIPEARGKAEESIARAEGYATSIVNRAEGDAKRFNLVLAQYKRAPKITRERMYLEAIEKILKEVKSFTVVDPKVKGLLPVFENPIQKGGK